MVEGTMQDYKDWVIETLVGNGVTYLLCLNHEAPQRHWCVLSDQGKWYCWTCGRVAPKGIQEAANLTQCYNIRQGQCKST